MTSTTTAAATDGALLRYRVMANIVGVLLVLLFVGVVLDNKVINTVVGIAHGVLGYPLLLLSIGDLWRRRRFPLAWVVAVALAGTVPFLSFVAERQVTARVRDGRL